MNCTTSHAVRPNIIVIAKRLVCQCILAGRQIVILSVGSGAELLNGVTQASNDCLLLGSWGRSDTLDTGLGKGGIEAEIGNPGFILDDCARVVKFPEGDLRKERLVTVLQLDLVSGEVQGFRGGIRHLGHKSNKQDVPASKL